MEDNTLVKSSFSATINASIESEYQSCSPAHCSAGATTSPEEFTTKLRFSDAEAKMHTRAYSNDW